VPPLCNYCFPHIASVTRVFRLSPFHCVTFISYSSKSRNVLVILPQHDLFHSPSSYFFIITTVPFSENNFSPHSSISQVAMLSFYHHDRYLTYIHVFHQYGYLAFFSTTGTSHIRLRHIFYIFYHDRYIAYFTKTNILHIFPPFTKY
jgi:hypothetical protein